MALRIIDFGSLDHKKMVILRKSILRAPLGLTFTEEELDEEKEDILLGCFDDDTLEGCCILTKVEEGVLKLRQMAVIDGLQGKGIGRALMNFAETIAKDAKFNKIVMNARASAVGFYEKLDYTISSDQFLEVTIPHFEMEKKL